MRRTRGGARRWSRWWTLALLVAFGTALFMRANVALLATQGTSMEPRFHTGDLAITVAASSYKVGDIAAYTFEPNGQTVLHRIVDRRGDNYQFKGDNNSWIDPVRAHERDLIGKLWLRIPHAGRLINLRSGGWRIALALLGGFLLLGGGAARRRRRRREEESEPRRAPHRVHDLGDLTAALALPAATVLVCLILAAISFHRPESSQTTAARDYTQRVRFGYTASAPSGTTYPDGLVTTGAPIFLKLVSSLRFQVTYDVSATGGMVHNAGGTYSIDAVVDGPASWRRTVPLQATTQFTGESFSTEVVVDIPQLRQIIASNAAETGVSGATLTVRIVPTVNANGFIDDVPFATTFAKSLTMNIGPTTVTMSTKGPPAPAGSTTEPGGDMSQTGTTPTTTPTPAGADDQLTSTSSSKYRSPVVRANKFELFSRRLEVSRARLLSGSALAMALIWLALAAATQDRLRQRSESTRILHRYRDKIVDVTSLSVADHVVDVAVFSALVKIAEQSDRFVLHLSDGPSDIFVVDDEGTRFRYVAASSSGSTSDGPPPPAADLPPPRPASASPPTPVAAVEPVPDPHHEPSVPEESGPTAGLIVASPPPYIPAVPVPPPYVAEPAVVAAPVPPPYVAPTEPPPLPPPPLPAFDAPATLAEAITLTTLRDDELGLLGRPPVRSDGASDGSGISPP